MDTTVNNELERETFKILAAYLKEDLSDALKSVENSNFKNGPNYALYADKIEIIRYFLGKVKHDNKDIDENSLVSELFV